MSSTVQVPGKPVSPDGNDLLVPLDDLLQGINLLGADSDRTGGVVAPSQGVAIIESGATAMSKWWSAAVAALGGTSAIAAVATRFWSGTSGGTRIAVVVAVAAVVAASLIALAIIVSSDVRGRATGATAVYYARATVAKEFAQASVAAAAPGPMANIHLSTAPPLSMADELQKLTQLHANQVLSDEEYLAQKVKLLAS
jgi:hypothetical protein